MFDRIRGMHAHDTDDYVEAERVYRLLMDTLISKRPATSVLHRTSLDDARPHRRRHPARIANEPIRKLQLTSYELRREFRLRAKWRAFGLVAAVSSPRSTKGQWYGGQSFGCACGRAAPISRCCCADYATPPLRFRARTVRALPAPEPAPRQMQPRLSRRPRRLRDLAADIPT
jgi:hypothetical protein